MSFMRSCTARLFASVMVLAAVFAFGCKLEDDDDSNSTSTATTVSATSVSISGDTSVEVGSSITLTAALSPSNTTDSASSVAWSITSGGDYATLSAATGASVTLTGVSAGDVTVTATFGTLTAATHTVTVAAALPQYPVNGATSAFADTQLILNFESTPTLSSGNIYIYTSSGTCKDTIAVASTSDNESQKCQSGYTLNVGNQQLVRVSGTKVYIQPHYGVLSASTSYYVLIASGVITGTLKGASSAFTGFTTSSDWAFTTGSAPSISTSTAITVSNATSSNTADFFSVYGAMKAAAAKSSGTYTINIAAGTYYELISVSSKGADIILHGPDSNTKGDTCVIEYVNNQYMNSSTMSMRPSFYFSGADLTLENVTLKNLTARATSYTYDGKNGSGSYQAETLMFASGSGHYLNAYNSSFTSLQDTLYTTGKAWFYNCYVAGDVDYIWGTSDVALFENCALECVNDSATAAYLFETRVGSTSGTTVGKGYVLYNSTVTIDSGVTAYYGRRASTVSSSTAYYDQCALVNVDFTGSGTLSSKHWYEGNTTNGVTGTLYGDYADIGWKEYGVTQSSSAVSTSSKVSDSGVITSTEYTNEYSGRRAILNRVYNVSDKAYDRDTSTNFAVDKLISSRGYSVDADTSSETLSTEATSTSVTYDFRTLTSYSQYDKLSSMSASSGSGDDITLTSFKWHSSSYGAVTGSSSSTITIPVTGACTVCVYGSYTTTGTVSLATDGGTSYGSGTLAAGTSSSLSELDLSYTGSDSDSLVLTFGTSSMYVAKIVVTYTSSSSLSLTISGDNSVAVGSSIILTCTPSSTTSSTDYSWYFSTGTSSDYATLTVATETTSSSTATLTGVAAGTANVYCAVDGVVSSAYSVSVTDSSTSYLSYTDSPSGFASYNDSSCFNNYSSYTTVTVSTHSALKTYAAKGGYIIYVSGMIDLSDGMIPTAYDGTTDTLNSFISSTNGTYTSYSAWRTAYAAQCATTTDDETENSSEGTGNSGLYSALWTLSNAYKAIVQVPIASNTMIIGLTSSSGVKDGNLSISGVSNVAIRNMTIQDAYDPFPHHENGDGYNAQYDGITIQGTNDHIWIDHCTFKDSFKSHVYVSTGGTTSEKWVTYDGFCDIKGSAQYITVSYCKFMDHDKTMLIGSADNESFTGTRTVTLHHNYFTNCVQRLPMVRLTNIHIYNNYYDYTPATDEGNSSTISSGYAIGVRASVNMIAEYNYFDSSIKYAFSGSSDTAKVKINGVSTDKTSSTLLYQKNNTINCTESSNSSYYTATGTMPFTPSSYYTYTADTAATVADSTSGVRANAGAGVWTVKQ